MCGRSLARDAHLDKRSEFLAVLVGREGLSERRVRSGVLVGGEVVRSALQRTGGSDKLCHEVVVPLGKYREPQACQWLSCEAQLQIKPSYGRIEAFEEPCSGCRVSWCRCG